jgi:hypothetical protein
MCMQRMWIESVLKIQYSHSHYSYSGWNLSQIFVCSTLYPCMLSLLQIYFHSGQSHFVLLAMHLLIASSWVSCATIFRRAVQAPAFRCKWCYLLGKSIFLSSIASWCRVDSTVVKLIQYIIGSGVATACEMFFTCFLYYLISKPFVITGHVLSQHLLWYETVLLVWSVC